MHDWAEVGADKFEVVPPPERLADFKASVSLVESPVGAVSDFSHKEDKKAMKKK